MALTSILDSQSLHDTTFELTAGNTKTLNFPLPSDFVNKKDSRKPILMYTVLPKNSVSYNVKSNVPNQTDDGDLQDIKSLGERVFRSVHEALDGTKLDAGLQNRLVFKVTAGRARFSDIVLFYQRHLNN